MYYTPSDSSENKANWTNDLLFDWTTYWLRYRVEWRSEREMQIVILIPEFNIFYLLDKVSFKIIVFSKHRRAVHLEWRSFLCWGKSRGLHLRFFCVFVFPCLQYTKTYVIFRFSTIRKCINTYVLVKFEDHPNLKICIIICPYFDITCFKHDMRL